MQVPKGRSRSFSRCSFFARKTLRNSCPYALEMLLRGLKVEKLELTDGHPLF